MMKALSLRGDYVMDIIRGQKKIEYRSWQTKYRGPILLCSTVKKVHGAVPGYALCVAMIKRLSGMIGISAITGILNRLKRAAAI